jgi:hypothetical protein
MTKRFLLVAIAALSVFAGSTVAQGATKPTKHTFTTTLKARVLTSSASGAVYTGILSGSYGEGSVIIRVTAGATAGTFNTAATAFYKGGAIVAKGSNTATARTDGSGTDYTGSVKAVKGTGIYKGVTGTVKLTGSSTSADPTYGVYKLTGTLTY